MLETDSAKEVQDKILAALDKHYSMGYGSGMLEASNFLLGFAKKASQHGRQELAQELMERAEDLKNRANKAWPIKKGM